MKLFKSKVAIPAEELQQENDRQFDETKRHLPIECKLEKANEMAAQGMKRSSICKHLHMDLRTLRKYLDMSKEEEKINLPKHSSEINHLQNLERKSKLQSEIKALRQKGYSKCAIATELSICRHTVTKYLDEKTSLVNGNYGVTKSNTLLSPYHETINSMILQGYTSKKIEEIIKAKGYSGSSSTIRMYATRMKKLTLKAETTSEKGQKVEFIERSWLIKLLFKPLEKVKQVSESQLHRVLIAYPLFNKVFQLVLQFRGLLKSFDSDRLDDWLESAKNFDLPELNSFSNGLIRDIDAVKNAITYTYSNGLAEGSINKIKVIKRIMYGRCTFNTLRSKVLLHEKSKEIN
jgi:predicted transcriptional regulator